MFFRENPVHRFIALITGGALVSLALSFLVFPPAITTDWLIVAAALLVLSLVSELLALRITARGSVSSMDFVPQLGAILLLGPVGAGVVTATSWTIYQSFFTDKPFQKAVFNVGQFVLSVTVAGLIYIILGGQPSLSTFDLAASLLPFGAAVVAYFAINNYAVIYVITLSEGSSVRTVWQELSFAPLVFDLIISSLALLVAYLYVSWNAFAMLAVIVPIIGLRYSYGVNLELKQLNSDLLRVLINTIEAQDPYTSGHSIRVAEMSKLIARELDLSASRVQTIETAALLHDIGKIDNAYHEILQQQGHLNAGQRQLIKEHPDRGVEIVESVRALDSQVLECIRHHHEHYDGSGYPAGLAGESIPLGARIIMVSDTIDAMRTTRPYRNAIPLGRIQKELKKNKGKQFDPNVVDAALEANLFEQIREGDFDLPDDSEV